MNVQLDSRSEELVEQQLRGGKYRSAEEVVARALEALVATELAPEEVQRRRKAVQDMRDFAPTHGFTLGEGLTTRDLLHEGHRH